MGRLKGNVYPYWLFRFGQDLFYVYDEGLVLRRRRALSGRAGKDVWSVSGFGHGSQDFYAERIRPDGTREYHDVHAHCLQCAKAEVLMKYGGRVDLRGWHLTTCGTFLYAVAHAPPDEKDAEVDPEIKRVAAAVGITPQAARQMARLGALMGNLPQGGGDERPAE